MCIFLLQACLQHILYNWQQVLVWLESECLSNGTEWEKAEQCNASGLLHGSSSCHQFINAFLLCLGRIIQRAQDGYTQGAGFNPVWVNICLRPDHSSHLESTRTV